MSRLIIGQITIKKERAISSTKWYYLLQPANANPPDKTNYGNPPPTIAQIGYSGWSETEPSYTVGDDRKLYEMVLTVYTDGTFEYTTPSVSSSYEASKAAYAEIVQAQNTIAEFEELGLKQGYIWDNMTYVAAHNNIPVYPVGSYIASGIVVEGQRSITRTNSNTYGLNTWISTGGINLRYNAIDLMKLTTSNLEFYYPSTSSQQKKAISLGTNNAINSLAFYGFNSDNKTMELTNSGLFFYNPNDGTTTYATLNINGLKLVKGGIEVGKPNTNDFVYLSTDPYGTYTIHDSEQTDWKQIVGTNFGIRSDGSMYATSANISGTIHAIDGEFTGTIYAESGSIGGFTIGSTELYSQDKTSAVGLDEGTYIGPNGFGISGGDALNTTYFTQNAVSIGGLLEWTAASGEEEQSNLSIYATEIYLGTLGDGLVPSNLNFLQDATADDDFAIKTLLTNTITEISSHKTQIEENKEKAERMIADFDNYYKPYITTTENNQNGYIQLKRKDNSNASSIKITDSKIEISINQQMITAFEGTLMRTTFGEFENLRMKANSYTNNSGYLTWIARSNGHLSLKVVK